MIYQKSKRDKTDFFSELDYYLSIARGIGKRTVEYLKKMKASSDPLMFIQGGLDGGTLGPDDTIEEILKYSTISFGYIGLHELSILHLGKKLSEDNSFAIETMEYINKRVNEFKEEDHLLWAVYGTPAESLAPLACTQFIKEFGKMKGITDKQVFSNSFHLCVEDDVTPIEKIDKESVFFPLSKGGCICHVRIPSIAPETNLGVKAIIRHAMSLGMYQSVNHAQNRCKSCGHHWIGDDSLPYEENYTCPNCGSLDTVGIRRIK